jgi:hypothetical protein
MGKERRLHRMKPVTLRRTFDRKDVSAVVTDRKREARIDPAAIGDDRASAALSAVAALFGSCQMQVLAKKVQEGDARVIKLDGSRDTVYGESR